MGNLRASNCNKLRLPTLFYIQLTQNPISYGKKPQVLRYSPHQNLQRDVQTVSKHIPVYQKYLGRVYDR